MKVLTFIALLFGVSALPAQASVIQWTYKANPLTLVGPPQPWDSLVEPNPYDGVRLSISKDLLDFSGGAVSLSYSYNIIGGMRRSDCVNGADTDRIEVCLSVESEYGIRSSFAAFGTIGFPFGAKPTFVLSGGNVALYGSYGSIIANVKPDLSMTADFTLRYDPSGLAPFVGSSGDAVWGCESIGCSFYPSLDRSQFPPDNPLLSTVTQYTASGGTWVLAAVPLPGSVYGMIAGLGALGMFARGRRRRAEEACNPI